MSAPPAGRPLPVVDADSAPFWAALRDRRLMVQWCGTCDRHVFYPRALCPHCHAELAEWVECSGSGTIHSYTVARRPAGPAFAADVPYVVVLVDLDEGVRMLSNLVTDDVDSVRIGARVAVRFEDVTDEITLPLFEPAPDA
ncbi:Zn-ribbon domain-containing OB-fold protein [Blastococcus tunisiensis]|uniref:Zn-ribbon domain-containing OB-fold protein n=1 Tax=Blastococcus tunisiensis TaxID=1798228 RepID=A0A1I1ZSF7_9ACTN|nr:Zn-ribbon domain-containing OB-fold protein [Blastococcus sp. DSM 46838]SFE34328.1 hypothetical protein SAMN05216574_103128 [Blastococcus sp. DSM 46838]